MKKAVQGSSKGSVKVGANLHPFEPTLKELIIESLLVGDGLGPLLYIPLSRFAIIKLSKQRKHRKRTGLFKCFVTPDLASRRNTSE